MAASYGNNGAAARVLVVEDFPAFRRFICSTLSRRSDLRVIAEVSDGLEAVQKVAKLKPDLILLDIGLPTISGIQVARQIRKLSPESKIVFVSQESSADVVEEAISTGAWGYVVKSKSRKPTTCCRGSRHLGNAVCQHPLGQLSFLLSNNSIRRSSLSSTVRPKTRYLSGYRRQAKQARMLELSITKSRSPSTLTASGIARRRVCPDS